MAAPKRTALEIERDRAEITSLYIRGKTQTAIAEKLEMTQQMVSYDLKSIQARWRKDTARDLDADKAKELAKLDVLEREFWEAWERSTKDAQVTETSRTTLGQEQERVRAVMRRHGRDGNPSFLDGVFKCIDRRCKLLGLDQELGTEANPLNVRIVDEPDLSNATDEELDSILDQAEAVVREASQRNGAGPGGQG